LAVVNPCGFPLLPAFLSFYLGADEDRLPAAPTRVLQGLMVGGLVALGFLGLFTVVGLPVSLGVGAIADAVPWVGLATGVVLALTGLSVVAGRQLRPVLVPRPRVRSERRLLAMVGLRCGLRRSVAGVHILDDHPKAKLSVLVVPSASQLDTWAREFALDPGEAAAALVRHDLVHGDARTGAVTVAYPFSAVPTRHRVRLSSGGEVFAMCAIDALGIAFLLGEATNVSSTDPGTGEPIAISLALTEPGAWLPADAVVVAGCEGTGTSLACTCPHTNFAASPEHARALLDAAPSVTGEILPMPAAIERGRETFGGLLERDAEEVAHADRYPA
jgi:hypothetical protein